LGRANSRRQAGARVIWERKRFFFSKKRAKKRYQMGQRRFNQHGLKEQSFFCFFFVHKKEVLTYLSPRF